ncbi:MAG: zinc metalloprotease HtpX [Thermodesulfobacteriota bacterium]
MNHLKTALLMAALTALFLIVGRMIGGQGGMTFALVMALVLNFGSYWFSDRLALAMSGARPLDPTSAPRLTAAVDRLCRRAGLPRPRLYLIPGQTPNAFATGRNPEHAAVAVTQGLLELLSDQELEGVLAHELAHVKNRDILLSSIAAVMAGAIGYLASMAQWALIFGGGRSSDDEEGGAGGLGLLVAMIVAPLAATIIQLTISRSREYAADRTGAEIAGSPEGLASALGRLEQWNRRLPMAIQPAQAQMFIVNPLKADALMRLFSTHPPIQDRIRRLLG